FPGDARKVGSNRLPWRRESDARGGTGRSVAGAGIRPGPVTMQPAVPTFVSAAQWSEDVDRAQKSEMVAMLNTVFSDAGVVVVARNAGLSVAEMTSLRTRMRQAGASVKVAKNRLAKLALQGTDAAHIEALFEGPTLIA